MKIVVSGAARRVMFASGVAIMAAGVMWLFEMDDNTQTPVKTVPVLVAKTYLTAQSVLDAGCCYEKRVPEPYAPPKPLSKKDLIGARFRARGEILKDEILTASRVSDAAASSSAGWDMADNEMAVTVHLTPEAAMTGVITPGDTVDVLVTLDKRVCVLVNAARVLAVGKRRIQGAEDPGLAPSDDTLITLTLDPKDALRAQLASQKALLSLALVSPLNPPAPPACVALGDL
jgi:Flp pilus assembly protein CpaB